MKLHAIAKILAVLPLAIVLTHCDQTPKPKLAKPGIYAFDVSVKLSPKAEAAVKQQGELEITADAWYYGDALPAYRDKADNLGRIFLGDETWTFSRNARRMHLKGEAIDTGLLPQVRDGQPLVFLSVTIPAGNPENPVKCHDYIAPVRAAQQTPPVLTCEFDTERYWEDLAESAPQ